MASVKTGKSNGQKSGPEWQGMKSIFTPVALMTG
jgi:hypothetical protein